MLGCPCNIIVKVLVSILDRDVNIYNYLINYKYYNYAPLLRCSKDSNPDLPSSESENSTTETLVKLLQLK